MHVCLKMDAYLKKNEHEDGRTTRKIQSYKSRCESNTQSAGVVVTPTCSQKNIFRFQISMDDADFVKMMHGADDLRHVESSHGDRKRPLQLLVDGMICNCRVLSMHWPLGPPANIRHNCYQMITYDKSILNTRYPAEV